MSTQSKYTFLLFLLSLLSAFGPFVTDLYLPALPSLAEYFSVSPSTAQLSLTMSMLGLSLGQLFIGPLSDKYGRKSLLVICLLLFFVGTLACILSPNAFVFNLFRLCQGMAASGGIVIARSIAADCYRGKILVKFLAMVSAINGVAPILAPVLGGFLLNFMNWKGTFAVLLFYGMVLIFMSGKFQESLPHKRRSQKSVLANFSLYGKVFRNKTYLICYLVSTFSMIILFGYISASPFIYQKLFHLSPMGFSFCFALNALFTALGCAVSGKIGSDKKALFVAGLGMFVFSLAVSISLLFHVSLMISQVFFMGMTFMFGMSQPPANALALNAERRNAGTASAALGASAFLMGSLVSPLVGIGDIAKSFSVIICIGAVLTLSAIFFAIRHLKKN